MNPMTELIPMLKQLRLSGILDSIEDRSSQTIEEKLSYMDFSVSIVTFRDSFLDTFSWLPHGGTAIIDRCH
jgi:hypothetical protein